MQFIRLKFLAVIVFVLTASLALPSYGLGLGDVKIESYIGQNFVASIPLLSVSDTNSLLVEVTPSNNVALQPQTLKVDDQLMVRISSDELISEPYLQFSVKVADQSQTIVREFTVLLDINPQSGTSNQNVNASTPYNSQSLASERIVDISTSSGDILGPYEWAKKGEIPSRFGAVLDGQSLWRVARRINTAMGVSINQMMWALYTNNPNAFSNDTIESLRAGVYLDVPNFSLVSNVSDAQAKRNLDSLSAFNQNTAVSVDAATPTTIAEADLGEDSTIAISEKVEEQTLFTEPTVTEPISEVAGSTEAEFKLLGLDDTSMLNTDGSNATNAQAIETINVLSVTVGNLTQELINKDKQIEFLEEKVAALESVAALDSSSSELASTLLELPSESLSESIESSSITPNQLQIKPWYLWLGLLLIALLGLLLFRNKLKRLNLFGGENEIEFAKQESTNIITSSTLTGIRDQNFSTISAAEKVEESHLEDDLDDGYNSFSEISINYIDDDSEVDIQDPKKEIELDYNEFEQNLEKLIAKEDYDEVVELLTSSRNKVIDDDRYYFERLRCYFLTNDEDGFYAFYDEIEYTIQHFPENWNRQISEMVIELGQNLQMDRA